MKPFAIARWLCETYRLRGTGPGPAYGAIQELDGCLVTFDSRPAAGVGPDWGNAIYYPGVARPMTEVALDSLLTRFHDQVASRVLVYVSPCDQQSEILEWLSARRFAPLEGPSFQTLVRPLDVAPHASACDLEIRQALPGEIETRVNELRGVSETPGWLDVIRGAASLAGYSHWLALDAGRAVALGLLAERDGVAYLGHAATAKSHRGRGAQSALITARLRRARDAGCRLALTETAAAGGPSAANLARAGFIVAYRKTVCAGAA